MELRTQAIPVKLDNDQVVHVQATVVGGEEYISDEIPSFKSVTDAIEGISQEIIGALAKVKPSRASAEFGLEVALESGKLTALWVKGSGTASLKVTLEWGSQQLLG